MFLLVGDSFKWVWNGCFGNQWKKKGTFLLFSSLLILLCWGFLQVCLKWLSLEKMMKRDSAVGFFYTFTLFAKSESWDEDEMTNFISLQRTQNTHFWSSLVILLRWLCECVKKFHSWQFGSWIWMKWDIFIIIIFHLANNDGTFMFWKK